MALLQARVVGLRADVQAAAIPIARDGS